MKHILAGLVLLSLAARAGEQKLAPSGKALGAATAPVTLDVTIDGTRRESRAFTAGERLVFQAQREMTLGMSDADAVQLTINGQPAVALGPAGEARTVQIGRQNYGSFLASQ